MREENTQQLPRQSERHQLRNDKHLVQDWSQEFDDFAEVGLVVSWHCKNTWVAVPNEYPKSIGMSSPVESRNRKFCKWRSPTPAMYPMMLAAARELRNASRNCMNPCMNPYTKIHTHLIKFVEDKHHCRWCCYPVHCLPENFTIDSLNPSQGRFFSAFSKFSITTFRSALLKIPL